MSQKWNKVMVDDIQNQGCTAAETEALLDAFAYTVKQMAAGLSRKAWYALEDYATSKRRGIDGFTLMLERKTIYGQTQWWGQFECGQKRLAVMGVLEAP